MNKRRKSRELRAAAEVAIAAGGGPQLLASKLGITSQAVSQWWRIPSGRVVAVSHVTGIPRIKLRPDLYA
jgi:DNA-binding transcriptional regulator YdaS (Cro superfamily)